MFRVSNATEGVDNYMGYYAGIKPSGAVVLGAASNGWRQIASAQTTINIGTQYHVRVRAVGSQIQVFVGDMNTPLITATDGTYSTGQNGVRVYSSSASFDNVSVAKSS